MSDEQDKKSNEARFINANRRGFLQGAAVASGVAATGVASAANPTSELPVEPETPVGNKGYEPTEYVKKYYQRARF